MDEPVPTSGGDRVRRTAARHGLAQLGLGVPPPPLVMLDQGLVLVAPYPCLPSSRGSWGAGARVGSLSDSSLYAPRRARPWSPRRQRPHLLSVAARVRLNRLAVDNERAKARPFCCARPFPAFNSPGTFSFIGDTGSRHFVCPAYPL